MGFLRGILAAVFVLGLSVFQTGFGWASDVVVIDPRSEWEAVYDQLAEHEAPLDRYATFIRNEETLRVLAPVIENAARAGDKRAARLWFAMLTNGIGVKIDPYQALVWFDVVKFFSPGLLSSIPPFLGQLTKEEQDRAFDESWKILEAFPD